MQRVIQCDLSTGDVRFLHHDTIAELAGDGEKRTTRASHINFNEDKQRWEVTLPDGELVYFSKKMSECYTWEEKHFNNAMRNEPSRTESDEGCNDSPASGLKR